MDLDAMIKNLEIEVEWLNIKLKREEIERM